MQIEVKKRNSLTIITLAGNLDAEAVSELEARMKEVLDGGGTSVAIAMSGVAYICSAGLRVLLAAQRRLASVKGSFCLVGVTKQVREVLDVTGLVTVLKIHSSLDDISAAP